jgi:hypothetical protein
LAIGYFEWASWLQVGIAAGIIVLVVIILSSAFPIKTATLILTTASGEAQALTSRDIAGVDPNAVKAVRGPALAFGVGAGW